MKLIDRYGQTWSDEPPPGSFNRVYDDRGRLISWCTLGPASESRRDPPVVNSDDERALDGGD